MPRLIQPYKVPKPKGRHLNHRKLLPIQNQSQKVPRENLSRKERTQRRCHHQRTLSQVWQRQDALPHAPAQIRRWRCHRLLHMHVLRLQVQNQQLRATYSSSSSPSSIYIYTPRDIHVDTIWLPCLKIKYKKFKISPLPWHRVTLPQCYPDPPLLAARSHFFLSAAKSHQKVYILIL